MRRARSQPGPLRGQQQSQQTRVSRRRRSNQQLAPIVDESTESGPSTRQPLAQLRRSARLSLNSARPSIAERASEAEASRSITRRQSRNLREARRAAEPLPHNSEEGAPAPAISVEEGMGSTSRPNHSSDSLAGPERLYTLEVAVQPPRVAKSGARLYPPLAIRVHISDANTGEELSGEDELNSLFAQATLYGESGDGPPLAPPDLYLLSGRLSMSLDLLSDGEGSEDSAPLSRQQGSYVIFPDLMINRTGRYRLGVSLFKIGDQGRVRPASTGSGGVHGGGTSLEEVKSNVIVIQRSSAPIEIGNYSRINYSLKLQAADFTQLPPGSGEQQFLEHIRNRGANVPSPPSAE